MSRVRIPSLAPILLTPCKAGIRGRIRPRHASLESEDRLDREIVEPSRRCRRCVVQGTRAGICAHWFELPQRKQRTIIGLEPDAAGSDLSTLAPQTGQFA